MADPCGRRSIPLTKGPPLRRLGVIVEQEAVAARAALKNWEKNDGEPLLSADMIRQISQYRESCKYVRMKAKISRKSVEGASKKADASHENSLIPSPPMMFPSFGWDNRL